jgi:hypothetical protein
MLTADALKFDQSLLIHDTEQVSANMKPDLETVKRQIASLYPTQFLTPDGASIKAGAQATVESLAKIAIEGFEQAYTDPEQVKAVWMDELTRLKSITRNGLPLERLKASVDAAFQAHRDRNNRPLDRATVQGVIRESEESMRREAETKPTRYEVTLLKLGK